VGVVRMQQTNLINDQEMLAISLMHEPIRMIEAERK
jgi:hypothetical protein